MEMIKCVKRLRDEMFFIIIKKGRKKESAYEKKQNEKSVN